MEIINIENVTKSYAAHVALDNITLNVPQGSVFGLLGPNGAGKTSLIRIINQITAPDSGQVKFRGELLNRNHINQIGYLPEERGLYRKMEVGEQALYLAQLKGMSRAEAMKELKVWFEKFELKTWWKKKIEELSKGMAQKIQFIATVIHKPSLLILDEPFTGFDPINANLIRDELLAMKQNGTSIILSTHRMESVEELCTHIALINKSKKILEGPVKEIRKEYKNNMYEVIYDGNNVAFGNSLWGPFELVSNEQAEDYMKAKIRMLDGNSPNSLLQALIPNVTIHSFTEIIPSMNDIFIQKVNEQ